MYPKALSLLCCPHHPDTRLALEPGAHRAPDGELIAGWLRCPTDSQRYRVREGIPDLLGPTALPFSPAQVVNYLPPAAWAYERTWRPHSLTLLTGEPFGYQRELPLMLALLAPQRGGLYLDLACSNGLYARAIDRHLPTDGHVVALDHSLPMLKQARAFARHTGQHISFVRASAQALPFAPAALAGVAMGGSLNEIGDTTTALHEIRRVLTPEGRFVSMNLVQAESTAGRWLQRFLSTGGLDFWPLDSLNSLFEDCGLSLAAQWRYRVVVFSLLLTHPVRQAA